MYNVKLEAVLAENETGDIVPMFPVAADTNEEPKKNIVAVLLKAPGIDANAKDGHGRTALMFAARGQHGKVVAELMKVEGIDVTGVNIEEIMA